MSCQALPAGSTAIVRHVLHNFSKPELIQNSFERKASDNLGLLKSQSESRASPELSPCPPAIATAATALTPRRWGTPAASACTYEQQNNEAVGAGVRGEEQSRFMDLAI